MAYTETYSAPLSKPDKMQTHEAAERVSVLAKAATEAAARFIDARASWNAAREELDQAWQTYMQARDDQGVNS